MIIINIYILNYFNSYHVIIIHSLQVNAMVYPIQSLATHPYIFKASSCFNRRLAAAMCDAVTKLQPREKVVAEGPPPNGWFRMVWYNQTLLMPIFFSLPVRRVAGCPHLHASVAISSSCDTTWFFYGTNRGFT